MATSQKEQVKIVTPKFRLSFPALFEAVSFEGGKPKFGLTMLFDKKDPKFLEFKKKVLAAANEAVEAKWPDPKTRPGKEYLRHPFSFADGDQPSEKGSPRPDGYAGQWVVVARSGGKTPPGVVDKNMQRIIDENEVYAGCYAIATVTVYAYDVKGNKGVALSLQNVMKVGEGQKFTGRSDPEQDFKGVEIPDSPMPTEVEDDNPNW